MKIMSRHFRAIAMKTVEEQYWTDRKQDTRFTYTQADAEAVTAEDGRVILMDEHLADSDAMDYDMDRADGEWALSDYVQKGIEVLDNDTGFFMMCEGGKIDWACFQPSPGRFPSSADGSGFTHLLLMYMNLD